MYVKGESDRREEKRNDWFVRRATKASTPTGGKKKRKRERVRVHAKRKKEKESKKETQG